MKTVKLMTASVFAMALSGVLAGCMNLPQTKALITPVGVVGIHSFAPPPPPPSGVDFINPRRVAQDSDRKVNTQSGS